MSLNLYTLTAFMHFRDKNTVIYNIVIHTLSWNAVTFKQGKVILMNV